MINFLGPMLSPCDIETPTKLIFKGLVC